MARMGTTSHRNRTRDWELEFTEFGFGADSWAAPRTRNGAAETKGEPQHPVVDVRIVHVLAGTEGVEDVEVSIVCPECDTKVLLDVAHEETMQTAFSLLAPGGKNGKSNGMHHPAHEFEPQSGQRPILDTTWRARGRAIREELEMLLMSVPVAELMRPGPSSVREDARLNGLAASLSRDDALIVLDEDNRPVGMINASQAMRASLSVSRERFEGMHVRDVMSPDPFCVRSDAPLARAMELFNEQGAFKVAVVGEDGKLAGTLTPADLLKFLQR